ncbi:MAG TPA: GNAT family N-acetyltransferase [Candidatus Avilachnospira avicola]|nr:GNAT family N-acetyltransferase [Candidatus Avilachnospira avicola]
MQVRGYRDEDLEAMTAIWNEVIEDGEAFPQEEILTVDTASEFFSAQTYTAVAEEEGKVVGLYILHPNNVGRCGHIANTSYAVSSNCRGRHIGEQLVKDSLIKAKEKGFKLMQFNAVVESNIHARHLYERLGFQQIGMIPEGFRMKDGHYENIYLFYYVL